MATSAEGKTAASLREGKTAASLSEGKTTDKHCESCEEDTAGLFCLQCNMTMCKRCGRIHTKVPATRDHTVKSITEKKSSSEGSAMYNEDMYCSQHKTTAATMLCEQCSELVCPSCAATHRGHKTTQLTSDIKALQEVNIRGLQGMISDFHNLGQRKGVIEGRSTLYADALQEIDVKRSEIIDAANKYADSLKKDVTKEKSQFSSKLTPLVGSVTETMTKTDKQITMLNSIKTSTHRQVLLRGIQDTFVLKKLNTEFMGITKQYDKVSTVDTLLPYIEQTSDVKGLIKTIFTMSSIGEVRHNPVVDFSKYALVGKAKVGRGYRRFCDSSVTGYSELVLVFKDSNPIISIYNSNLSPVKTDTHISDIGIHHLAKVNNDQYVAAHGQHVYLLDDKFQVLGTNSDKYSDKRYNIKSICAKKQNTFIECCIDNSNKPYKLHVNEVNIKSGDFHTINILSFDVDYHNGDDIICGVRDNTLVVAQNRKVYTVDLNTRSVTTHDIYIHIYSLCLDVPGYVLIGDNRSVHVYADSMHHVNQVDVGNVHGIAVVEGDLFVSVWESGHSTLQKYQQKA